jgi:hypothetical protein
MFTSNSRYRNLPQAQRLNAQGEWLLSVDLRFIPPVSGTFLHTVRSRERVDLLAFKYYNDPRRWWLIADANPDTPFPPDLLDTRPIAEEEMTLAHPRYLFRSETLIANLQGFGTVQRGRFHLFGITNMVTYTGATTRRLIVDEIQRSGFHLISSFAWQGAGGSTVEAFTFEDGKVKLSWNRLVADLASLPGMLEADSTSAGESLHVRYNESQLSRQAILWRIEQAGFEIVPAASRRADQAGARITIPPNQAT